MNTPMRSEVGNSGVPVRARLKAVLATKGTTLNLMLRQELMGELDRLDEAERLLLPIANMRTKSPAVAEIRRFLGLPEETS